MGMSVSDRSTEGGSEQRRHLRWLLLMPLLLVPPYMGSNRLSWLLTREVPRLALDDAIPFQPALAGLYLALFPLMWLAVLAQRDAAAARRLVLGMTACAWTVSLFFVLVPTTFARPEYSGGGLYASIVAWDTPRNAFPSLHGTYAVMSAAWIAHARGWRLGALAVGLAIAILYATIAVRQHGIIDLAVGGLIGLIAFFGTRRP